MKIIAPARCTVTVLAVTVAVAASGCGWQGANSLPLPGTEGGGPGAYTIQAQLPDVDNIERNSRVRVGDVNVGTVIKIERQGWHALLTMDINGDVSLPANAIATVGQTSLLGSKHIELAPPLGTDPEGRLGDGSLIPLSSGDSYPTTERTLAALSLILNGGGIGQIQDITQALSSAFAGREADLRSLLQQLDIFMGTLSRQSDDIIDATQSLNDLAGQVSAQKPLVDRAIETIPEALHVLNKQRDQLVGALDSLGKFSALAADTVSQTKENLVAELRQLNPALKGLADAGLSMTRSLSYFATYPWPNETLDYWVRGDYGNLTAIIDLTLSRLDASLFTGTRWEGNLTELEMQWGRTIGQMPSPYTAGNPLVVPYRWDQGR
ncbi:MCE family protein [Mycobacterium sp. SMC-8]|uniref:MCE family protein n=1 Tax=Mycobacterium sp. SMC-8 TaxID=2857060 RepID=UPI0021B369EB|nr:MCE family protein [Mycobacterium sp. SMC-8]UXA11566.1 MCE family protein [Mycobacterium sp. SMC-8]